MFNKRQGLSRGKVLVPIRDQGNKESESFQEGVPGNMGSEQGPQHQGGVKPKSYVRRGVQAKGVE